MVILLIGNIMWRPTFTILQKVVLPSFRDNLNLSKLLFSTKSRLPKSTSKLTLVSASIGVLVGAGYGGYTHYKVNVKKTFKPGETEEYAFLKEAPEYAAHYKVRHHCLCILLVVQNFRAFI